MKMTHFKELNTIDEVTEAFKSDKYFFFINSSCPNSSYARKVLSEIDIKEIPKNSYTVYAGRDMDAVAKARELLKVKPSSPAFYIIYKGKVIFEMNRDDIIRNDSKYLKNKLLEALRL
jgi:putative YphP/YqiW family bacilliredoxin